MRLWSGQRVQGEQMTGYMVTRYYRAPEIMLSWRHYHEKVDIWSAGCILAEMLSGKVLFPGCNHVDQFSAIARVLGSPSDSVLASISSQNVRMSNHPWIFHQLTLHLDVGLEFRPFTPIRKRSKIVPFPSKGR